MSTLMRWCSAVCDSHRQLHAAFHVSSRCIRVRMSPFNYCARKHVGLRVLVLSRCVAGKTNNGHPPLLAHEHPSSLRLSHAYVWRSTMLRCTSAQLQHAIIPSQTARSENLLMVARHLKRPGQAHWATLPIAFILNGKFFPIK